MLAGMLGWGQGTFVSAIELDGERAIVTREVDNGLQIVQLGLPAVLTAELSLNEPRYASLPDMMRARKQVIEEKPAESYGIDLSPRLQVLAVRDHPPRKPGVIVASVAELVGKLRQL
jgi:electron transfer flavoprotein beta subunit